MVPVTFHSFGLVSLFFRSFSLACFFARVVDPTRRIVTQTLDIFTRMKMELYTQKCKTTVTFMREYFKNILGHIVYGTMMIMSTNRGRRNGESEEVKKKHNKHKQNTVKYRVMLIFSFLGMLAKRATYLPFY